MATIGIIGAVAHAAHAADAAEAGDFAVVAVPLELVDDMPVEAPAGKTVLDENDCMVWRDGHIEVVDVDHSPLRESRRTAPHGSRRARRDRARAPDPQRADRRRAELTADLTRAWRPGRT